MQKILTAPNCTEQEVSKKREFISSLEALRGFVALLVVFHHVFVFKSYLDPQYFPTGLEVLLKFLEAIGHIGVLIFFVLSGFVIGLSTKDFETKKEVLTYLKKRAVRLYPIYIVSIVFALLVSKGSYSLTTILHNLTFTQIVFSPVIIENSPIWSLQHEVTYYLLFIPLSFFRINPLLITFVSILVAVLNYFAFPIINSPAITSYAVGFAFWASGLVLAKYTKHSEESLSYPKLVGLMFFILSLPYYNKFATVFYKVSQVVFNHQLEFINVDWAISLNKLTDLSYLPYFLLIIFMFSGARFKFDKHITLLLLLLPGFTLVSVLTNLNEGFVVKLLLPSLFYAIFLILFLTKGNLFTKLSERIIKVAIRIGGISYGIYIVHFPILYLFHRTILFSGSSYSFVARLILYLTATIAISYFLEKKLQPLAKKHL